jgi:hypothetical protein
MQSVILISNNNGCLNTIEKQYNDNEIHKPDDENKLSIESKEGRLYITLENSIISDYEDKELDLIRSKLKEPLYFYLVNYSDKSALTRIIKDIKYKESVYIDDDNGSILPCADFQKKV